MKHDFRGWHGRYAKRPASLERKIMAAQALTRALARQALIDQAVRNVASNLPDPRLGLTEWSAGEWMPKGWRAAIRSEFARLAGSDR
jgi:hypothetical protein